VHTPGQLLRLAMLEEVYFAVAMAHVRSVSERDGSELSTGRS
jgi:hypothetical protein